MTGVGFENEIRDLESGSLVKKFIDEREPVICGIESNSGLMTKGCFV